MKRSQLTFTNPDVTIKLTKDQAIALGINPDADKCFGEMETGGPWGVEKKFEAVCISRKYTNEYYTKCTEVTIYGRRTLSNLSQGGYELNGWVSINGKKYSAFTSSMIVEVDGKLIDVEIIHARVKD